MRSDTLVNGCESVVMYYPAVEKYVGMPQAQLARIIRETDAGVPSGVIREFNTESSTATIVKKGQQAIRRRVIVIHLSFLPPVLKDDIIQGGEIVNTSNIFINTCI